MQIFEPDGNLFAAGLIATAILEGAYTITPDFQYVEQLITSAEPIVPAGGGSGDDSGSEETTTTTEG
jgi:hypothetical protein